MVLLQALLFLLQSKMTWTPLIQIVWYCSLLLPGHDKTLVDVLGVDNITQKAYGNRHFRT